MANELFPHVIRAGIEKHTITVSVRELETRVGTMRQVIAQLVNAGKDFPRRLRNALPKKNALKKSNECISAVAADRLEGIMRKDIWWSGYY